MSTRSFIGIKDGDNIEGIYCHFDGYIEGVGATLNEHYKELDVVKELVSHGSMSSIGDKVGTQNDFDNKNRDLCCYYHRDRGDEWSHCNPNKFQTIDDFVDYLSESWYDYVYLFENGEWNVAYCSEFCYYKTDGLKSLESLITT